MTLKMENMEHDHNMMRLDRDETAHAIESADELLELSTSIVLQRAVVSVLALTKGDVQTFLVTEHYLPECASNPEEALSFAFGETEGECDVIVHAGNDRAEALAYARDVLDNLHAMVALSETISVLDPALVAGSA
jgi:hypothetical protein